MAMSLVLPPQPAHSIHDCKGLGNSCYASKKGNATMQRDCAVVTERTTLREVLVQFMLGKLGGKWEGRSLNNYHII